MGQDRIESSGMEELRGCRPADDVRSGPRRFLASLMQIEPQWMIIRPSHMAYYNVMFDRAIDEFMDSGSPRPNSKALLYDGSARDRPSRAECHVRYLRELHLWLSRAGFRVLLVDAYEKRAAHVRRDAPRHRGLVIRDLRITLRIHLDMIARKTAPFHRIFPPASRHWRTLTIGVRAPRGHRAEKFAMPAK